MSALLSIGEATHAILQSDAELGFCQVGRTSDAQEQAITRARRKLTEARATLAAVQFALRSHALVDALTYHELMADRMRQAARLARMIPGRGLYQTAAQHDARAKALRALIGTAAPLTAHVEQSAERSGG